MLKPFIALALFSVSQFASAEVKVSQGTTLTELLTSMSGQSVSVTLKSGKEFTGKVGIVGQSVLHIKGLSGKEFYDAVINVNDVSAVVARNR